MRFHPPSRSAEPDNIERPHQPLALADTLVIGLPSVAELRRNKGKNHRPFDLSAGFDFDHSQAGRVHPNQTSVRGDDLDAFRTGLKNSLEKLPIVLETASLYSVSTLIGMRNSL